MCTYFCNFGGTPGQEESYDTSVEKPCFKLLIFHVCMQPSFPGGFDQARIFYYLKKSIFHFEHFQGDVKLLLQYHSRL